MSAKKQELKKMKRKTFAEAIREDKILLIVVYMFVLLDVLVWLNEVLDITKIKRAEETLGENKEKLSSILQSITDHMNMMDKELNIIWANETAKKIFGKDIIGKKCYEVYHKRKEPCVPYPCLTLKAFKDGKVHEHDTEVISQDGEIINQEGPLL